MSQTKFLGVNVRRPTVVVNTNSKFQLLTLLLLLWMFHFCRNTAKKSKDGQVALCYEIMLMSCSYSLADNFK